MKTSRKLRGEEGAAAVEFALVVGLLFVILFGIMEFGLAFFELQNLRSSAREGARAAAIGGDRAEVSQALVQGASGSLPNGYSSFTPSGPGPFCSTKGAEIKVTLPLTSLPPNVQSAFLVDIPLIPQIKLTPTISGSFRCE